MASDYCASIPVEIGSEAYDYILGDRCIALIAQDISRMETDRFLVVTDDAVLRLHGDKLIRPLGARAEVVVLSFPPGERMKTLDHLTSSLSRAIEAGATRRSAVVAFGGGVPGNLGGMLAALLFRGVRLVHVPTTTMAAMDSVLSAKQAVNGPLGKNQVGAYHTPTAVYVDIDLLRTLPARELRSGLCETAKNCLAIRPQGFDGLEAVLRGGDLTSSDALMWMLRESIAAKAPLLARDPRERQAGIVLEYGHTVGHAIEFCDQRLRGPGGISHGEAVAIGMIAAAQVAETMGLLPASVARQHERVLGLLGITPRLPDGIAVEDVIEVVRSDNKRGFLPLGPDEAAMVLLRGIGQPAGQADLPLVAVPLAAIEQALAPMASPMKAAQPRWAPAGGPTPSRQGGMTPTGATPGR